MTYTNCWLNYKEIKNKKIQDKKINPLEIVPDQLEGKGLELQLRDGIRIVVSSNNRENEQILINGISELKLAFHGFYRKEVIIEDKLVVKTQACFQEVENLFLHVELIVDSTTKIHKEGYTLQVENRKCTICSSSETGVLYGIFAFIRYIQVNQIDNFQGVFFREEKEPSNPHRMLNHWDNMDGSVERGYSGESFFFENNKMLVEEEDGYQRIVDYARMIASVNINGVVINNVNVKQEATKLISSSYYSSVRKLSEIFASYGVRMYLSINFAAPMELGGLDTSDPCDENVIHWWKEKSKEVYENVPLLGGYLVKADSEGRPGPFTYGRTHADGANMLANSINSQGGLVIWRCFVYNCKQDWRDKVTDRARAGYDNFMPIDGHFADNVILQIKNGPMDFQVREPISPLFGGLKNTNMMLEVQIAQEYTGQQRHVCYLIPWFKEILNFPTYCSNEKHTVAHIVSGETYKNINCGMVAVTNTGNGENWTGHDLAAANLYGFGRLSYDTNSLSTDIGTDWIIQTFGDSLKVRDNILKILMMSWPAYEKYTSPLGIGWMVKPNHHYGPDVDGYEYDRWGTYHRATHTGIGVDRTENGTNYVSQYNEPLRSMYSKLDTCPEELLLFFHHVRYDYILSSGKTVIQHIYDTHFEGSQEAENFYDLWMELQGLIDSTAFERGVSRFTHQKEHAKEWCDVINSYFYRKTSVEDRMGRQLY